MASKILFNLTILSIIISLSIACRTITPTKTILTGEINPDNHELSQTNEPVKGEGQKATLRYEGDEVEIPEGLPFEITLYNLDPKLYDLHYSFAEETKMGKIKVVRQLEKRIIELLNKCQRITIGPGSIPEITTSDPTPKLKIVITPRYSKTCEFIGYEIRYGGIEQGCKEDADIRKYLRKCNDPKPAPSPLANPTDYWTSVLFGG